MANAEPIDLTTQGDVIKEGLRGSALVKMFTHLDPTIYPGLLEELSISA